MEGWFKFERAWLDNGVINKDNDHLAIYLYLCAKAAFEPLQRTFGKEPVVLQPGQLITGRRRIAEDCRVTDSKVNRVLTLFEKAGIIRQEMGSSSRIITLISPDLDLQVNHGRTTSEPPVNHERTTGEPRANTYKELENEKKERAKKTRAGARKPQWNQSSIFSSDASYDLDLFNSLAIGLRDIDRRSSP